MSRMTITDWSQYSDEARAALLQRPAIGASAAITTTVNEILETVRRDGDAALRSYTARFDRVDRAAIRVSADEIAAAGKRLPENIKAAMAAAVRNIEMFHAAQQPVPISVETQRGIRCEMLTRPIASVGLYIPGGTAPLLSTVLMLGVPARLAGCRRIVLCSPPGGEEGKIADEILYAASLCGIDEVFAVGGAQAVAALAFGTETVPRVDKIFGPGNAYVTEAKRQVSMRHDGAAIDMPAGPSEVLVIADERANPTFVAIDLLSQAEHGTDSQVVLTTPSAALANAVADEVERLLKELPRADIARQALAHSRLLVTRDLDECVAISNAYGPEHLILQTREPQALVPKIQSAGSVFVGDYSPESVGDYASGTNHVLPTYGYTHTYSSLGLADFQKRMTVQTLSPEGLMALATTVETLAAAERLDAHRLAVRLRVEAIGKSAINKTGDA
ncbi:MAG: histidinol dehydrogenase [Proteobacteria bacterium]|nr:histidinol dehydrogenase [Pseudomonadota bacterium]MCL2308060.1 histidinol dehydrogenase [Pseudomonadota bacterium]